MESIMKSNYGEVSKDFGEKLKQLRTSKDMSLREVEEKTGISAGYVCRLESGEKRAPTIPIICKLAQVYNLKSSELFSMAVNTVERNERIMDIGTFLLTYDVLYLDRILTVHVKNILIDIINDILLNEWNRGLERQILEMIDDIKNSNIWD